MATPHPTGWWVTQQPRNLLIEIGNCSGRVRFLIQDRDRKFTATFDVVFAAEAIQVLRTPVRAPRANAYASDGSGPFGGRASTSTTTTAIARPAPWNKRRQLGLTNQFPMCRWGASCGEIASVG